MASRDYEDRDRQGRWGSSDQQQQDRGQGYGGSSDSRGSWGSQQGGSGSEGSSQAGQGYGRARGEAEDGVGAIAVVVKQGARVLGTMSVAAPLTRLTDEKVAEIVPLLKHAASNMAIAWGAS